ncbi:MAG: hypothetical protein Q7K39_04795 [Candidatus Magasanikbacteria bacterium]|nr:hypothetical protein [Candidatus Magasanikbacteria bacterium]
MSLKRLRGFFKKVPGAASEAPLAEETAKTVISLGLSETLQRGFFPQPLKHLGKKARPQSLIFDLTDLGKLHFDAVRSEQFTTDYHSGPDELLVWTAEDKFRGLVFDNRYRYQGPWNK